MEECLNVLKLGWQQQPTDAFLGKAVALFNREDCTVRKFYGLCTSEIQKVLNDETLMPPYAFQNNWTHNAPLMKAMVKWILNGRRGEPRRLGKDQQASDQQEKPVVRMTKQISYDPAGGVNMFWIWGWRLFDLWAGLSSGQGLAIISAVVTQQQANLQTNSTGGSSSSLAAREPFVPPKMYGPQMDMGLKLWNAIGQSGAMISTEFSMEQVDFRVILPPKVSLAKQTRERLFYLLWEMLVPPSVDREALRMLVQKTHELGFSVVTGGKRKRSGSGSGIRFDPENPLWQVIDGIQLALNQRVLSTNLFRKGLASQEFVDLCKCVFQTDGKGRRRRVLIIGDEAHFGACRNGQVDVLFHGTKHSSSGNDPNWLNPLCEPNVVIVHVSATAWNLNVVPFLNVLDWTETTATTAKDESQYVSWEAYAKGKHKDKAIFDGDFDQKVMAVKDWLLREASPGARGALLSVISSLVLMVDYAMEFWRLAWLNQKESNAYKMIVPPSAATGLVVEKLLLPSLQKGQQKKNDSTVLIRVQRGGIQLVFARWLKLFRSLVLHNGSSSMYQVACPSCPSESEASLSAASTLLVVVERGRMGDTWPNLAAFDLRARYGSFAPGSSGKANCGGRGAMSACFSSFLQDAGRCFGHRATPPLLVLNQRGYQLLQGETYKLDTYLKPLSSRISKICLPGLTGGGSGDSVERKGVVLQPAPRSMFHRLLGEQCEDVLEHFAKNRILFYAGSQRGKTGAFLALIALFLKHSFGSGAQE